jgi:hypothetical protein
MKLPRAILIFFCFSVLAFAAVHAENEASRLPLAEVRRIADAYASRRPDFDQFRTRCFLSGSDYWNVLYVRKGAGTPDHFSIRVSNKTKRAWLAPE